MPPVVRFDVAEGGTLGGGINSLAGRAGAGFPVRAGTAGGSGSANGISGGADAAGGSIPIDAIADEVCDVDWDGAGLVCKQALKDTLKSAANGTSLAVDDFVRLCESDAEDDLSLYETRYGGESDGSDSEWPPRASARTEGGTQ